MRTINEIGALNIAYTFWPIHRLHGKRRVLFLLMRCKLQVANISLAKQEKNRWKIGRYKRSFIFELCVVSNFLFFHILSSFPSAFVPCGRYSVCCSTILTICYVTSSTPYENVCKAFCWKAVSRSTCWNKMRIQLLFHVNKSRKTK